ncbi:MAG: SPFH domain-containing protein [Myxococcaceae bacterium]|nr:SPFH domain-containing protein [Myxococcaceae bacterium]
MQSALGWLGELAGWFAQWVPRLMHVRATEAGVRFIRGKAPRPLPPGLHLYWPITTEVESIATVRQVMALDSQVAVTRDGHTVVAGGLVVYRIVDAVKFLAENYDAHDSVKDVAQAAVRQAVLAKEFQELRAGRAAVENKLTAEVQKVLVDFGVEVEYVRLADLAGAQVLCLYNGGRVGGSPLGALGE